MTGAMLAKMLDAAAAGVEREAERGDPGFEMGEAILLAESFRDMADSARMDPDCTAWVITLERGTE